MYPAGGSVNLLEISDQYALMQGPLQGIMDKRNLGLIDSCLKQSLFSASFQFYE